MMKKIIDLTLLTLFSMIIFAVAMGLITDVLSLIFNINLLNDDAIFNSILVVSLIMGIHSANERLKDYER